MDAGKSALQTTANVVEEPILSIFLKALTEKYSSDYLTPGVTIAWVEKKKQWYASIARFPNNKVERVVSCGSDGETLEQAIRGCMKSWQVVAGLIAPINLEKFGKIEL